MANIQSFGKPVVALEFKSNQNVFINTAEIEKLLNHRDVRDRKIVIFSIIGAFRGGKSFFLDYCLRFLYTHVSLLINNKHVSLKSNSKILYLSISILQ